MTPAFISRLAALGPSGVKAGLRTGVFLGAAERFHAEQWLAENSPPEPAGPDVGSLKAVE